MIILPNHTIPASNKKLFLLVIAFITFLPGSYSQNSKWNNWRGESSMLAGDFDKAVNFFKKSLDGDSTNYVSNINLGQIYLFELELYDSAEIYLSRAMRHQKKDTVYSHYFDYARCYQLLEKPKEALVYYRIFSENYFSSDQSKKQFQLEQSINDYILKCKNSMRGIQDRNKITQVENIGFIVNSVDMEYTPVLLPDNNILIYNGRYEDYRGERFSEDDKYMENVYYYNFEETTVSTFDETLDQKNHWAIVSVIPNSDSIIVYHVNALFATKSTLRSKKEYSELPSILTNYYQQPHCTFSPDRQTIIFSARETDTSKLDLYVSNNTENKWSVPVRLPLNISSVEFDEDSPYLSNDGKTLYFSSNGKNTYGGYDVFKSVLIDNEWSEPLNMGYPINSAGDDIYFTLAADGNLGFLSSNRSGGFGRMDIYSVEFYPTPKFDCEPFENEILSVNLDLSESIDSNSAELTYKWNFEDGESFYGESVDKTFQYPGLHKLSVTIIENESGKIEEHEILEEINFDSVNYIGFRSVGNEVTNEVTTLDAGISYLEGYRIIAYNWKLNDTVISLETPLLSYTFEDTGSYEVSLQIDMLSEDEDFETFCYQDIITIVGNEILDSSNDVDSADFANNNEIIDVNIENVSNINNNDNSANETVDVSTANIDSVDKDDKEIVDVNSDTISNINTDNNGDNNGDNNSDNNSDNETVNVNSENVSNIGSDDKGDKEIIDVNSDNVNNNSDNEIVDISSDNVGNNGDSGDNEIIDVNSDIVNDESSETSDKLIETARSESIDASEFEIEDIYFDFDDYGLSNLAKKKLDSIIYFLQKVDSLELIMTGHTDWMGSSDYNIKLSKRRNESAYKYLVQNGLDEGKILRKVSKGENEPAAPNSFENGTDNAEGRKLNRRVNFVLVNRTN